MSSAIPIILCGQRAAIAQGVKAGLLPEYEVIHVILTPTAGVSDIPALLRGEKPPPPSTDSTQEQVGTQNYSQLPAAVVLGGGYEETHISEMREACKEVEKGVTWLRPDLSVPTPPLGPEYGRHMVGRVKDCMNGLVKEGKLEGDGVYWY